MRIFIIGGTGFLGRHLLPKLHRLDHEITVLTRSRDKANDLESPGIKGVVGDLLQPESFMSRISPQDVVISVAMPEIRPGRISANQLRLLQRQTTTFFSTAITLAEQFNCPLILTLGTSFRTTGKQIADLKVNRKSYIFPSTKVHPENLYTKKEAYFNISGHLAT